MSYSIVTGVAENEEIKYCPYCGATAGLTHKGNGMTACSGCDRDYFVIDVTGY